MKCSFAFSRKSLFISFCRLIPIFWLNLITLFFLFQTMIWNLFYISVRRNIGLFLSFKLQSYFSYLLIFIFPGRNSNITIIIKLSDEILSKLGYYMWTHKILSIFIFIIMFHIFAISSHMLKYCMKNSYSNSSFNH